MTNILEEADSLINGERQEQYGNATESFERIAQLWTAYLGVEPLTGFDVANLMILLKVSRSKASLERFEFHRDSFVDIAGYAALAERLKSEIDEVDRFAVVDFDVPEDDQAFIDHVTAPKQPRVWDSLVDVPHNVSVLDNEGDPWTNKSGRWGWRNADGHAGEWNAGEIDECYHDDDGPFTEILEDV